MDPTLILSGVGLLLIATTTGAGMAWRNSTGRINGLQGTANRIETKVDEINGRVRQTETDVAILYERVDG